MPRKKKHFMSAQLKVEVQFHKETKNIYKCFINFDPQFFCAHFWYIGHRVTYLKFKWPYCKKFLTIVINLNGSDFFMKLSTIR